MMKINFLKFLKRDKLPSLKSLRPHIFRIDFFWSISLSVFFVIFLITTIVGFKLFYSQYFETYKDSKTNKNFEEIIKVNSLKASIEKRNKFINEEISIPKDPSI